jgi:hypothetical protein
VKTLPEYPCELFVPFEGDEFYEGRLTLNLLNKGYSVEVELVQKESKKIVKAITTLYHLDSEQEACDRGMQELATFVRSASSSI